MRTLYVVSALAGLALAGAAQAADWDVEQVDGACRTEVALTARGGALPMTLIADGERLLVQFSPPAGAALTRIEVDGRPIAVATHRQGDRIEAPLTPELERALAKGLRVRAVWSRGPSARGSLIGSAKGLTALRRCGDQVRIARQEAERTKVVDAAEVATASATEEAAARQNAIAEARRRYQREVLATIGAGVMGAGTYAPERRTYDFPGVGQIVCSANLESFDCH